MTGQGRRYSLVPVEEAIHLKLRGELRGETSKACLHQYGPNIFRMKFNSHLKAMENLLLTLEQKNILKDLFGCKFRVE